MIANRFGLHQAVTAIVALGLVACSSAQTNPSTDDVDAIVSGDWSRLPRIDIDQRFLRRVASADQSAPYALGRVLEAAGRDQSARQVYTYLTRSGSEPFAAAAAVRQGVLALERERWALAAAHGATARAGAPGWADAWYVEAEAAYRGRDWDRLLALLDDLPEQLEPGELATHATLVHESLLWRAVWALEQQREVESNVVNAFLGAPADAIHSRLYLFMTFRDELGLLGDDAARLADAVYRASQSEWEESARLFALVDPAWLAAQVAEREEVSQVWRTVRTVLRQLPDERLIAWTERVAAEPALADLPDRSARPALVALEASAAAARAEADDDDLPVAVAAALAERALALAEAATETVGAEATLVWLRLAEPPLPQAIERMVALGLAPGVLADHIDRAAPPLVRSGDWAVLAQTAATLPRVAVEARAMLAIILGAAEQAGLWRDDSDLVADLLPFAEQLGVHRNFGYHFWAARILSGESVPLWPAGTRPAVPGDRGRPVSADVAPTLARAGQWDAARRLGLHLASDARYIDYAEATATALWEHGAIAAALDVTRRAEARFASPLEDTNLNVRFPLGYAPEIRAAAETAGIDAALLFAIVREESHFNAQAISVADAIGLAQVLESTAEVMASRIELESWDVTQPSDNALLGAAYLAFIAERVQSPMLRVAAYNAGHSRGTRWETEFGSLPPLLQIEAIPFFETRWYVRKVLVSYLHYAALEHGDQSRAAFRRFLSESSQ